MHSRSNSSSSSGTESDDQIDITDISNDNVYYVERILSYRYNNDSNSFEYYVQWLDCPAAFCSWEEECSIIDKDLITEFWNEEQRKVNKLRECEIKVSKLMDGISRINDALMDENVLERIQNILNEMPIRIVQKPMAEVNR
eukprot:NODE_513_length_6632_cov_0.519301.p6 type:complete len:141 gc:universal NODE_513_length_6632_cov_0.519301:2793-2371(-)